MGAVKVRTVNDYLLDLEYENKKTIKTLLGNWMGMERLSLKGDTVATSILLDLKLVTGIDPHKYGKSQEERSVFNNLYTDGKLSYAQYISIAYVLVLGYTQEEVAFMLKCSQQAVNQSISNGVRKIQIELLGSLAPYRDLAWVTGDILDE